MIEILLSDLLENIKRTQMPIGSCGSRSAFLLLFADGKIESNMIKYIYSD